MGIDDDNARVGALSPGVILVAPLLLNATAAARAHIGGWRFEATGKMNAPAAIREFFKAKIVAGNQEPPPEQVV